jgi:hypothetical protein
MSGAAGGTGTGTWPADVIHVNEDGWVLINRGQRAGVFAGLQLLVVGSGVRALRNLFASGSDGGSTGDEPVVLRIRRTYEQLEVVYAEADCAVAVATRTPLARRPSFYRGPGGELLVWVPLPEGYTYPPPDTGSAPDDEDEDDVDEPADEADDGADGDTAEPAPDLPPETGEQDDKRWEEALPLNGVSVGDLVVPAIPVSATVGEPTGAGTSVSVIPASPGTEPQANPFEAGQSYDWLKQGE